MLDRANEWCYATAVQVSKSNSAFALIIVTHARLASQAAIGQGFVGLYK